MTVKNAINKLAKHGEVKQDGPEFWAKVNGFTVSFCGNGGEEMDRKAVNFRVRSGDGAWGVNLPNLAQAIGCAQ